MKKTIILTTLVFAMVFVSNLFAQQTEEVEVVAQGQGHFDRFYFLNFVATGIQIDMRVIASNEAMAHSHVGIHNPVPIFRDLDVYAPMGQNESDMLSEPIDFGTSFPVPVNGELVVVVEGFDPQSYAYAYASVSW